jgi:hypothetical protein
MDLQEEYFRRKKVPADLIRYVDRANLILRAKNGFNARHQLARTKRLGHVIVRSYL